MKKIMLLLVMVCLSVSALAEFRIWTDQHGTYLEAELSGTEGKKIILKKRDGKKITLSPLSLSEDDQKYLKGKVSDDLFNPDVDALDVEKPPRLEIEFKKVTDTQNNLNVSSYRDIDMYSSVTITKLNREPYSGKVKAEVYVIGLCGRNGLFVLLDMASKDFSFEAGQRETAFATGHIRIREYRYNTNYSTEYKGYLVVILDEDGKVLAMQSSSTKFEQNYQRIAGFKKGTFFSKRYEVDHVDSDGEYY